MIPMNPLRSGVLCGVLLMLASTCHAGSAMGSVTFQVETGKVSFDKGLNTSALTSKGYTVNSFSQSTVDEDSHGLSISIPVPVTSKISAELGLQKMGEIKSSLDLTLPIGINAQQAAQDIAEASPQQLGGLTVAIGAQPINQRLDLRLGAGVSLGKDDHRITINGEEFDNDDTSIAPYLKLGFGVKPIPSFVITIHSEWSQIRVLG